MPGRQAIHITESLSLTPVWPQELQRESSLSLLHPLFNLLSFPFHFFRHLYWNLLSPSMLGWWVLDGKAFLLCCKVAIRCSRICINFQPLWKMLGFIQFQKCFLRSLKNRQLISGSAPNRNKPPAPCLQDGKRLVHQFLHWFLLLEL